MDPEPTAQQVTADPPPPQPSPASPPAPPDLFRFAADALPALRDSEQGFAEGWDRPVTALTEEGSPLAEYVAHVSGEVPATRAERAAWHEEARRLEAVARAAVDDAVEHHGFQMERQRWTTAREAADQIDMAQANAGGDFLHDMFGTKKAAQKPQEQPLPAQPRLGRW